MKIAFNPSDSNKNILDLIKNNKDIIFDLKGHSIFARGVEFKGTDTWRPVVDNLTSDSTTSSLSANLGKVLAGLINGHPLIIDMRNYDGSYWHPVTVPLPYRGYNKIKVSVLLNSGDKPSWATHNSGFACNMEIWAEAHGWGTTNAETICLNYTYAHCNSNPCGWMLLGYPSLGVLFLRGGSRYKVWTDFNATFTPHDKTYTWTSEGGTTLDTGGPYTSCPGLNFNKNRIYANLEGSAYYLEGGNIPSWGTLTAANGFTNVSSYDYGSRGAYGLCSMNTALYMLLDGYFYQNEGKYRVIDTSDFNWTNLPGKVVAGNEFNIVNAGYNNTLAINYLPIDNRNGSATITLYNIYNGNKGLASVYAYRFKADGQSCMWKDARNYAPFYSTFNGGFEPILDIKTVSGDWSIGSYDSYGNHLVFAFTSDSDFNAGLNGTALYYLTAGGEFKINTLRLAGSTNANMGVGSTNPQIIFAENSTTLLVALTYTDWDSYRTSRGLKVHSYDGSDDSNVWFEVLGYNYSSGYVKNGSSNAYVLLGGGGHKPLSEFLLGSDSYLPYNGWWASGNGLDVNNANGMIFAYANHKNSPFSSYWGIITTFDYTYNSAYKFLLAANGYSNAMYYRSRSNDRGGWTSWTLVIDTGNIGSLTVDKSYHLRVNHGVSTNNTWSTWYWQGQSGQPTWLWGCNDGGNMYVWNPSNFRVAYASSAGNADTLDGIHANGLLTALSNSNNGISITVGGTTKSVSNISVNYASSAGSATKVIVNLHTTNDTNYPLVWSNLSNTNSVTRNQLYKSWSDLYYNPKNKRLTVGGSVVASSFVKRGGTSLQLLRADGGIAAFNWSGQSGLPSWLWGGNNEHSYYVYNPSNFRVAYATSAGSVSNSLNIFGVSYNGSAAKTVTTSTFISLLEEGTSTVTDGTMFITSVVSDSGFADTNAVNVPYKRKASCLWSYIDSKVSSKYLPLAGGTMNGNARIGHGSGNLYIGNSGNDGWIYTQDIASLNGTDKWSIRESGAAHFGALYIASKTDNSFNSSVIECNSTINLNYFSSLNVSLCNGGGNVGIGTTSPTYKLDVNGLVRASGFHHSSVNSDNYMLLAGGGYKSYGGSASNPIFLGYLNLYHGNDGTIDSYFYCLGYSVPFTYTRGGNYCKISIPNTTHQVFYIKAAIASVNYSGGGMNTWTGEHRGAGAWWLHCYASGNNDIRVKGFRNSSRDNDSWWGGNPLYSDNGSANAITVCLFGYVDFK